MSYRFVKVSYQYPEYLTRFYAKNPVAAGLSYESQRRLLLDDGAGWADFHSIQLRKLGVDAHELIANSQPLNAAWDREHGPIGNDAERVIRQIGELRPDIVFLQDPFRFDHAMIKELRSRVASVRVVLGWCAVPWTEAHLRNFLELDAILTCSLDFLPLLKAAGLPAFLLHHAFEPSLLEKIGSAEPDVDFTFSGSLFQGEGLHNERIRLLNELVANPFMKIRIYSASSAAPRGKVLAQKAAFGLFQLSRKLGLSAALSEIPPFDKVATWPNSPRHTPLPRRLLQAIHPPVYGLEMFRALQRSRISFNSHIDGASRFAANVRLFEATGVGSCLLTDWKENLPELFEIDSEVVAYRSVEDCIEKVNWLTSHPKERAEIAKAGQRRCLRDHNYQNRSIQLHQLQLQLLSRKSK